MRGLGQPRRSPHASSVDVERGRAGGRAGASRKRLPRPKQKAPQAVQARGGVAGVLATAPIEKEMVRSWSCPRDYAAYHLPQTVRHVSRPCRERSCPCYSVTPAADVGAENTPPIHVSMRRVVERLP